MCWRVSSSLSREAESSLKTPTRNNRRTKTSGLQKGRDSRKNKSSESSERVSWASSAAINCGTCKVWQVSKKEEKERKGKQNYEVLGWCCWVQKDGDEGRNDDCVLHTAHNDWDCEVPKHRDKDSRIDRGRWGKAQCDRRHSCRLKIISIKIE